MDFEVISRHHSGRYIVNGPSGFHVVEALDSSLAQGDLISGTPSESPTPFNVDGRSAPVLIRFPEVDLADRDLVAVIGHMWLASQAAS